MMLRRTGLERIWNSLPGARWRGSALSNLNLTDMEVGYKVFRVQVLKQLQLRSNRFGFEPEITIRIAHLGCRVYEVPISYYGRTYAEGKKIGWRDGIAALVHLFRYRFFD